MKQGLNILRVQEDKITFEGFDKINDVITVQYSPHSERMVIIPKKQEENPLKTVIYVKNKEVDDNNFLKLVKKCSNKANVVFIESDGIYYQVEQISI